MWRASSTRRAAAHLAHLVDGVGELEAAVLDMHGGLRVGHVAPVDVDDAAQVGHPRRRSMPVA